MRHWLETGRTLIALATRQDVIIVPVLHRLDAGRVVWRVRMPGGQDQYMCVDKGLAPASRHVVHVDAEAFYLGMLRACRSLRTTPRGKPDMMARRDMSDDSKYPSVANAFAKSADHPIPLALVGVDRDRRGDLRIQFTDGITRTFWLLANGCACFPVEVSSPQEAAMLFDEAGVASFAFSELFGS